MGARGMTLIELLIAGVIALIVLIGVIVMDVGRLRLRTVLLETSKQTGEEQQVGMAAVLLGKDIERADRVNILNTGVGGGGGDVQIRIPVDCVGAAATPACFDNQNSYDWIEYKRVGNELWRYEPGCTGRVLARQLGDTPANQGFEIAYRDASPLPAWALPADGVPVDDTNVLRYTLTWNNGLGGAFEKAHTFVGTSTMRAFGYMNVNRSIAGAGDSGTGLALSTIAVPDLAPPQPLGGC